MKSKILFALAALLLWMSNTAFAQKNKKELFKKHQIVMQLTSADVLVHKSLVKQLNNLKNGWGDTVAIEVVCHGPGLDFLVTEKTKYKEEIYKLKERGIVFTACENSMREREVTREAILPDMHFVLMGIGEIVLKQEQGWTYIKAGF